VKGIAALLAAAILILGNFVSAVTVISLRRK